MKRSLLLLGILMTLSPLVCCYNVLFMLPFGSKSHKNVFDPVAEELGRRGHKVVLFSSIEVKEDPPGVKNVFASGCKTVIDNSTFSYFQGSMDKVSVMTAMFNVIYTLIESALQDPFMVDIIHEPLDPLTRKPKFDVVIMDGGVQELSLAVGHHLGVPNIIMSPTLFINHHLWDLNVPTPLSYVPSCFSDFPEPLDFFSRVRSTFISLFFTFLMKFVVLPNEDLIIQKYIPNTPPLTELIKNVSFMMSHTHPALNGRQPGMPYTAEVGGLNCQPAKQLPKDLEDFMQDAGKDGVIYFSLGSITKGDLMPLEMRDKIVEAFSQLPQKILWKYEENILGLPKNVKLVNWAPQQDILGHSQLKLFITHGGGLSIGEASYHGAPMLAFPLSGDQLGNMAEVQRKGFGEYLDWKTFTSQQFLDNIKKLINDKSYKEKAMLASLLMKDRPQKPVETAVYWIEYVVRHNGAHFLKSSAHHLNFFQYFLLDVVAAAIACLIVILVILFYVIKSSCRLLATVCYTLGYCKKSTPKKSKSKKKIN